MEFWKICACAVSAVIMIVIMKQMKADIAPQITVALCVMLSTAAFTSILPLVSFSSDLVSDHLAQEYATPLIKSLGVAILAGISADICRDCGENAVASSVELVGKAEILIISLPMLKELLGIAQGMLS